MVCRMEITYDENLDFLDEKHMAGSTEGYTIPPGVYEITDNYLMLKSLLPKGVKVNITIDDTRLKSTLNNNKTRWFTKKSLFF